MLPTTFLVQKEKIYEKGNRIYLCRPQGLHLIEDKAPGLLKKRTQSLELQNLMGYFIIILPNKT